MDFESTIFLEQLLSVLWFMYLHIFEYFTCKDFPAQCPLPLSLIMHIITMWHSIPVPNGADCFSFCSYHESNTELMVTIDVSSQTWMLPTSLDSGKMFHRLKFFKSKFKLPPGEPLSIILSLAIWKGVYIFNSLQIAYYNFWFGEEKHHNFIGASLLVICLMWLTLFYASLCLNITAFFSSEICIFTSYLL